MEKTTKKPTATRKPSVSAKIAGYDAVEKRTKGRAAVNIETKGENEILNAAKRIKLIATQRDEFRNTTFSPATALQLQVNVVGNEGGKLTFVTDDADWNERTGRAFRKWSRHCGFTDGMSLNEMLQLNLIQLTHNGGDFIAVFDDGCLTGGRGTGKIRVFESDEIKPVDDGEFKRVYGLDTKNYQQNGLVYDQYGRLVGAFVSSYARGQATFAAGEYIHLRLNTPAEFDDANWILVANRWRVNQGRGVSTSTHVTNLLQDCADTQGSEVQAAKVNSSFGVVISQKDEAADIQSSRGFGDDTDGLTADEKAELAAIETEAENKALRTAADKLVAGQSAIVKLAAGKTMESFKTDRPNLNTVEFLRMMRNEAGTVFGLGPTYTTLTPTGSYTAFRGELTMAEKSFARLRKMLERGFLDWVAIRFVIWNGDIVDDFDCRLAWQWPKMQEVDEGSYQTALEKKFTLGGVTCQGEYGPDWQKIVLQQAAERKFFAENGLVYPADRTGNGSIVTETPVATENDRRDKQEQEDAE